MCHISGVTIVACSSQWRSSADMRLKSSISGRIVPHRSRTGACFTSWGPSAKTQDTVGFPEPARHSVGQECATPAGELPNTVGMASLTSTSSAALCVFELHGKSVSAAEDAATVMHASSAAVRTTFFAGEMTGGNALDQRCSSCSSRSKSSSRLAMKSRRRAPTDTPLFRSLRASCEEEFSHEEQATP